MRAWSLQDNILRSAVLEQNLEGLQRLRTARAALQLSDGMPQKAPDCAEKGLEFENQSLEFRTRAGPAVGLHSLARAAHAFKPCNGGPSYPTCRVSGVAPADQEIVRE
jgi:hypothetical protein